MSNRNQPNKKDQDFDSHSHSNPTGMKSSQDKAASAKDAGNRIESLFSGIAPLPSDPAAPPARKADPPENGNNRDKSEPVVLPEALAVIQSKSPGKNGSIQTQPEDAKQSPHQQEKSYLMVTSHSEDKTQLALKTHWKSIQDVEQSLSWESLLQGKPVVQKSPDGQPTILAYGHPMPKSKFDQRANSALLLEFLDESSDRSWSEDELTLVEQVTDQLSLALENARLFQETQNALSETERLYQASADLNASQTYAAILDALRKHTLLGESDRLVSITVFDQPWVDETSPTSLTPLAHWTCLPPESFKAIYQLDNFPAHRLLSANTAGLFEDIDLDERLDQNVKKLFQRNFQSESAIFIPLNVSGQWIGFILGCFSKPRVFEENLVRPLMALSKQAAISIQNIRLLAESQRRSNQLQTAAEIARDASTILALDDLFVRCVNLMCERFDYYHASIFLIDEAREYAYVRESTGKAGEALKAKGHKLAIGSKSIIGQATSTGRPVVLNDLTTLTAKETHYPNPLLPHTRSELGIPLTVGNRVIGALNVQSEQTNAFSADDVAILQTLADQIAVAVDNAQAYELVQTAMEETRQADRLKSQFLANMSHELRTPLNSIIGFSKVILKGIDGPINDLQQQDLTAIYNSGQHLLGLINDVLDLSKIEAGKMELVFEDGINLSEIVMGVMSTTVGLVKDKPIILNQSIDPDLPLLRIDPVKIRQVLLNLLANAAKFTESGSISLKVEVINNPSGHQEVKVSVTDTGVGIAEEDQSKLFQAFSQVDGSLTRKTGGSGLGLSICQHLIQMHQGRIGMTSEPGKGSTFYFLLPVETDSTPDILI